MTYIDYLMIGLSALFFVIVLLLTQKRSGSGNLKPETTQEDEYDTIEKVKGTLIHHGPANDRLYLMKLGDNSPEEILPVLENIVIENAYSKMFVKIPAVHSQIFKEWGFRNEAMIPGFYNGQETAVFMGKYYDPDRKIEKDGSKYAEVEQIMVAKLEEQKPLNDLDGTIRECSENDVERMADIYKEVFASYPFPIHKPEYLLETMESHVVYYCVEKDGEILALSSAEMDENSGNVEMTDFATPPSVRGRRYAEHLLQKMEQAMQSRGLKTAYTIARAISPGMNITFARAGYNYGGRLVNNTYISGGIESMNVWYKPLE